MNAEEIEQCIEIFKEDFSHGKIPSEPSFIKELTGDKLKYLYDIFCIIWDSDISVFHKIFGNNTYRICYDICKLYSIFSVDSVIRVYRFVKQFESQAAELEFIVKATFLARRWNESNIKSQYKYDIKLSFVKMVIMLIKQDYDIFNNIIFPMFNYSQYDKYGPDLTESLVYITFIRKFSKAFPDKTNDINVLYRLSINHVNMKTVDLKYYSKILKTITYGDHQKYNFNTYNYYLDNYEDVRLTAIKSFISTLYKSSKIANDSSEIIISKNALDVLYAIPGFKDFIKCSQYDRSMSIVYENIDIDLS